MEVRRMNWLKSGRLDKFRYVRVRWPDMVELEEIKGIVSATVTENSLTTLKASGTLEYVGGLGIGEDLVRVYSDSYLDGASETICHGTFFATTPQSSWSGTARAGKADMYSVLWVLQQNKNSETFTAEAGTNAVSLAKDLAENYGNNLTVIATASNACLNTAQTWDSGTTHLGIINDLLSFAGYASADVDAYGNVIFVPYVDSADKGPVVIFSDTQDSVSEAAFSHELDTFEVPNKVSVICSNAENEPMIADAWNLDPENPYSIPVRNKVLVRVERVSDIVDYAALERKAKDLLLSGMSVVESIEITHSFQPFQMGDALLMDYSKAGYTQKLVSVSREKQMVPGIRCKTKARRFVNLYQGG